MGGCGVPHAGHQYYEVHGEGAPLVLLHGHTMDGRIWHPLLPLLTGRFKVILPDLAGHGRSGLPPASTTPAEELATLLDQLAIPRAAVCGHSLGGAVAVSFALQFPARCAALITVDAALFGYPFPTWSGPRPYARLARRQGLEAALEAWLTDPIFPETMDAAAAELVRTIVREYPGEGWLRPAPAQPQNGPADAERLGEIKAPTLVLVGEQDLPDFRGIAAKLAAEIPGACQAVMPGAGHLLPVEQPEAFTAALLAFLSTPAGSP